MPSETCSSVPWIVIGRSVGTSAPGAARPEIGALTSNAREDCPCLYRIGLLPREGQTSRVYRASVMVRGKELPYRWRVRFLGDIDRWLRKASAVLANRRPTPPPPPDATGGLIEECISRCLLCWLAETTARTLRPVR